MSSAGILPVAVATELQQLTQQGVGTTTTLLKKALQADKDLVATLLPTTTSDSGRVNIAA
jgi:hypothetical protein